MPPCPMVILLRWYLLDMKMRTYCGLARYASKRETRRRSARVRLKQKVGSRGCLHMGAPAILRHIVRV